MQKFTDSKIALANSIAMYFGSQILCIYSVTWTIFAPCVTQSYILICGISETPKATENQTSRQTLYITLYIFINTMIFKRLNRQILSR